jgi:hypothetical protein
LEYLKGIKELTDIPKIYLVQVGFVGAIFLEKLIVV